MRHNFVRRVSESVLPGHPDKFCDQIADGIICEISEKAPCGYSQIEVAVWSDEIYINGGVIVPEKIDIDVSNIVQRIGLDIGYAEGSVIDVFRYKIKNSICMVVNKDVSKYSEYINDQSIVTGWAGYDEKTNFLPPEHFFAVYLRDKVMENCKNGFMKGFGPDGKIVVIIDEKPGRFFVKKILMTIMHPQNVKLDQVVERSLVALKEAYLDLKEKDERWTGEWSDILVIINPNGPFVYGGSVSDNGQTGRKLVIDFYGPRIPVGGGALSGKVLSHIDRLGAYAARDLCVSMVKLGAEECFARISYGPDIENPIDIYLSRKTEDNGGVKIKDERLLDFNVRQFLNYNSMIKRYKDQKFDFRIARGNHFYDNSLKWNKGTLKQHKEINGCVL